MKQKTPPKDTATFHYKNLNPKDRFTGDCVIRAIAAVTGKSWNEVFDALVSIARKEKRLPNDRLVLSKYMKTLGWSKMKSPRHEDNTKYTGKQFCHQLQEDQFPLTGNDSGSIPPILASIGSLHITAIIHGKVQDTWDCTGNCIGNYWLPYGQG